MPKTLNWLFILFITTTIVHAETLTEDDISLFDTFGNVTTVDETLTEDGISLSSVDIFGNVATVSKTIDISSLNIGNDYETYLFVERTPGNIVQKTSSGYSSFDANTINWNNVSGNAEFQISNNEIEYFATSIENNNFFTETFPFTIHIGLKDITNDKIYHGNFQVKSTLSEQSLGTTILSPVNIDVSSSEIRGSIDVTALNISNNYETYLFVESDNNATIDWNNATNQNFTITSGQLNYIIPSLQYNDLTNEDFPLTVYIGLKDIDDNQLYLAKFQLTILLTTVNNTTWNNTAVRKVLHTFAFGGFASDSQIQRWADMSPSQAIKEILTFNTVNSRLSPAEDIDKLNTIRGTLKGLSDFWSGSAASQNKVSQPENYHFDNYGSVARIWAEAVNRRGLNPVRQYLGLYETNYHLSVNQDVGINNYQIARYYDDIMNALAAEKPYQDVMALASTSAAVATQYNHSRNKFVNGKFYGNEDFSREIHQIFFGVLGDYDSTYHEETSIKNTAKALTDLPVYEVHGHLADECTFGTAKHHTDPLEIIGETISGATAEEKIKNLAQFEIEHSESLENLPIILIRGLADENLTAGKILSIQASWKDMETKNLLEFLRQYAISTIFHNSSRVKYYHSIHRHLLTTNKVTLNNTESYLNLYDIDGFINEGIKVFRPIHDVFGGQTGAEAADDSEVFRVVYKNSIANSSHYNQTHNNSDWEKDWASVISDNTVKTVAEWLWNHFIADGLVNFDSLARIQVYALLATGTDAAYAIDPNDADKVFTESEASSHLSTWENLTISLDSSDTTERRSANKRVGQAINFIVATPYMFVQLGR